MKILLKTMAAVALGMLATSAAQAQVTELRLAHMNGPQHSVNLGALKFKEAVEARTNGRVQVGCCVYRVAGRRANCDLYERGRQRPAAIHTGA